ncbi:MAG: DUF429 domain-containing protein [Phycisphaeraceae bacterium]|nr:DUF429 domain-containing protein [Phycisphaerales bacterium]MCB9860854.1 DUF429 domain-containing protein [Phycisphaeraceae bacterium]
MNDATPQVWVGADPGGKNAFGLALIVGNQSPRTWCVSSVDEAVESLASYGIRHIDGIGVDAPLWWSTAQSGARRVDAVLRKRYGLSGGNVQAPNSLRGAVLVQGVLLVDRVRKTFSTVNVTETHPKALLSATNVTWSAFCNQYGIECGDVSEHERDAVISAVAAREGFCGRWKNDLSLVRDPSESNPKSHWFAPVNYFWPE